MNSPGERLSKRVMQLRGCSRSEAEQTIEGGWVQVDGVVVEEPPRRVWPEQVVTVDPAASRLDLAPVTLLLHKPPGLGDGCQAGAGARHGQPPAAHDARSLLRPDTHGPQDPSGTRVLKRHFQRLDLLMPLEFAASGLLVATQDWRIARKLQDSLPTLEHEWLADVEGDISGDTEAAAFARIASALDNPRQPMPSVRYSVSSRQAERSRLRIAVKGSHPGLIAYLCEQAGLKLLALKRIRLGRVALGDVPVGQWRYLAPFERF